MLSPERQEGAPTYEEIEHAYEFTWPHHLGNARGAFHAGAQWVQQPGMLANTAWRERDALRDEVACLKARIVALEAAQRPAATAIPPFAPGQRNHGDRQG